MACVVRARGPFNLPKRPVIFLTSAIAAVARLRLPPFAQCLRASDMITR